MNDPQGCTSTSLVFTPAGQRLTDHFDILNQNLETVDVAHRDADQLEFMSIQNV